MTTSILGQLQIDWRMDLKRQLLAEGNGKVPLCPFCQYRNPGGIVNPASQMHEIISPEIKGGKYIPDREDPKVQAIYVLENLVLACYHCNGTRWLDKQDVGWVLGIKIQQPGYSIERVLPKILDLVRTLKYPVGVVPTEIPISNKVVKLDLKKFTYTLVSREEPEIKEP